MKAFSHSAKLQMFEEIIAPWAYIPIPYDKVPNVPKRGFKSVPIMARIGNTKWRTAMFPLDKEGYFIPIKKLVLKKEDLEVGQKVTIEYSPLTIL